MHGVVHRSCTGLGRAWVVHGVVHGARFGVWSPDAFATTVADELSDGVGARVRYVRLFGLGLGLDMLGLGLGLGFGF